MAGEIDKGTEAIIKDIAREVAVTIVKEWEDKWIKNTNSINVCFEKCIETMIEHCDKSHNMLEVSLKENSENMKEYCDNATEILRDAFAVHKEDHKEEKREIEKQYDRKIKLVGIIIAVIATGLPVAWHYILK